ncbi:hypothetical protein ACHQM5_019972 [Ranunculus cassubicifolius]
MTTRPNQNQGRERNIQGIFLYSFFTNLTKATQKLILYILYLYCLASTSYSLCTPFRITSASIYFMRVLYGLVIHDVISLFYFEPPPPLPDLQLSEEMINDAPSCIGSHVNALLSASKDISLGKDSKLFCKVAACLGVSSVVGGWTDFPTLGYTSVLILLTLPVLYEKYEDQIDIFVIITCRELQRLYIRFDEMFLSKIRNLILKKQKLS